MSSLDKMKRRLEYHGGDAEGRRNNDKLLSLKVAMKSAYQSQTAAFEDGREFKCLINPNKETGDYDNKILSIPYEDTPVKGQTSVKIHDLGIKPGDVFTWKETNTKWIIFLEYLEENAYFRAQIRKCETYLELNGQKYWAYLRGPVETSIPWNQKASVEWNDINYSLVMYVKKDLNSIESLRRFSLVKIEEPETGLMKTWQVVDANPWYGDGIIQVYLDEFYNNSIKDQIEKEQEESKKEERKPVKGTPYIEGPIEVNAYDSASYTIKNATGGEWLLTLKDKIYNYGFDDTISLDVNMKKGSFTISYKIDDDNIIKKEVIIKAF